jgi:hypothetical protein
MDAGSSNELTLDRAILGIEQIERLEEDGATIDELVSAIKELHAGGTVELPVLPEGSRLFRAREIDRRPLTQSEVSYPPAHVVTKLGRANAPGHSMFYSCWGTDAYSDRNNMIGCLWETRAAEDKIYALSEWQTMEPLPLYPFGYRTVEFLENPLPLGNLRSRRPFIIGALPTEPMAAIQQWESRVFTEGSDKRYPLSAALTKYALDLRFNGAADEWEKVAGIVYPSVANGLSMDNVCLMPNVVDAAVALLGVRILRVRDMCIVEAGDEQAPADAVARAEITLHETSSSCTDQGEIHWPRNWIMRSIFD